MINIHWNAYLNLKGLIEAWQVDNETQDYKHRLIAAMRMSVCVRSTRPSAIDANSYTRNMA